LIALNVNIEAETDAKILGKNILSISHPSYFWGNSIVWIAMMFDQMKKCVMKLMASFLND
jgi:hypothetical protein